MSVDKNKIVKLTGYLYEFDIAELPIIKRSIQDLDDYLYYSTPIKSGVIYENKVSFEYESTADYWGAFIKGFIYDDDKTFLGKVNYLKDANQGPDDIRGKYAITESGIFIYGQWESDGHRYGFAVDLKRNDNAL